MLGASTLGCARGVCSVAGALPLEPTGHNGL